MKVLVNFMIFPGKLPDNPYVTQPYVGEMDIYGRIHDVAKRNWNQYIHPPGHPDSTINIRCDVDDPGLTRVLSLLRAAAWEPYYGRWMPDSLRTTHFQVSLVREYKDEDFKRADYLWLNEWGEDTIAAIIGRRGDRWIGRAKDACWHVRLSRGGGNKAFVNDELRASFQAAKLKGLTFHPLEWDQPRLAKGKFWEIDSKVIMPPCLLPTVRSVTANMLDGSQQFGTFYDDGPYRPLELVFRRSEVESLGKFDIAHTREDLLWTRPDVGKHMLVVSQRFRRTLQELGVEDVSYGIVRLVSDDWQRPQNDPMQMPYIQV